MEYLDYLQPKTFRFEYRGFNYEGVATHEYFCDADNEIDFTGNYVIILLTPQGTVTATISPGADDILDEADIYDPQLRRLIVTHIT